MPAAQNFLEIKSKSSEKSSKENMHENKKKKYDFRDFNKYDFRVFSKN